MSGTKKATALKDGRLLSFSHQLKAAQLLFTVHRLR